jgi:hypothetical protein
MFGLLGGLLGRGLARPLMARPRGMLGGLMAQRLRNARSGGGGIGGGGAPAGGPSTGGDTQAVAPTPQTPDPVAAEAPVTPAAPQESPAVQSAESGAKVTENLLEKPPPVEAPKPTVEDKPAAPAQVVNKTDTLAPVAQVQGDQFPSVPQNPLSGLADTMDDMPKPRRINFEDPVPLKPADTKSQAKYGQSRPDMSFGLATTSTSYSPSYYFRG